MNGYPLNFIYTHIRHFLDLTFSSLQSRNDDLQISTRIIKIPYIGISSIILKKKIKQIFKKINKDFIVSCVFYTPKLSNFFSLKDFTPLPLRAGVIYEFNCEVDPRFSYIGKTKRHLGIRIKEHRQRVSAIYDHRLGCSCSCNIDNFKILDSYSDDFHLKILEAIYIKRKNPSLNKQLHNDGAFFACKLC